MRDSTIILGMVLLACVVCRGQALAPDAGPADAGTSGATAPASTTVPDAAPVTTLPPLDPNYLLQPDDVIEVVVFREPDLTTNAIVRKDGEFEMKLLGPVKVAGLSVDAATEVIRAGLAKDYLVSPRVSLSIVSYAKKKVNVLGEVRTPGLYSYPEHGTLMLSDAIAMAGGLLPTADAAHVTVRREVGNRSVVTPVDASDGAAQANTYEIEPDDAITVAVLPKRHFTVLGQINRPGDYDVADNRPIYLTDAIALAGGFTRLANPAHVVLKRTENGHETVWSSMRGRCRAAPPRSGCRSRTRTRSPCRKACFKMHAPRDSLLWAGSPLSAQVRAKDEPGASEIVCVILEKLWLIVLVAIAGFFATYGYLARQAPVYQAVGTLQVVPPVQVSPDRLIDAEPNLSTTEQLNTLVQELVRPSFLLLVANDPDVQNDLSLFPPKPDGTAYTDQEKIETLAACIRVTLLRGTLLIEVSARHTQPATAQRLCAAMLHNFVKERMENKSGSEEETYRFLLGEADRLGGVLADEERQIQKYAQLATYDAQITAQKQAIEELSQRYKDKYPAMIEARSLLRSLQDNFDAEMTRIVQADEAAGREAGRGARSRRTHYRRDAGADDRPVPGAQARHRYAAHAFRLAHRAKEPERRPAQRPDRDGGEDWRRTGAARTARVAKAGGDADWRHAGGRCARPRAGVSPERAGSLHQDGRPGRGAAGPARARCGSRTCAASWREGKELGPTSVHPISRC